MGMVVDWQEVEPGRPNVIAHWPEKSLSTNPSAKRLMLSAHMDTVPTTGMTIPPFDATLRDGRIWGRGACDTKGSLAAMLTALRLAYESNALPSDSLYFVATMSEETGCDGATALMQHGFRADAAIVGEPTSCQVVAAHKGPVWFDVETKGRACHASLPEKGINAIETMSRIVEYVSGPWQESLRQETHPLLGHSTACVTTIEGGSKVNIIPDRCRAQIDGRFVPGRTADEIEADLRKRLQAHLDADEKFTLTVNKAHTALDCPPDAPVVQALLEVCHPITGQRQPSGVNYFADTGPFSAAGIPSVLFGPGDIAQAHTADEFLELEQLYQATEILLNLLISHADSVILPTG
jgi:acetylornithine deacetylase